MHSLPRAAHAATAAASLITLALLGGCAHDHSAGSTPPHRAAAVRAGAPQPFLAPGETPVAPGAPAKPPPALAMEDATRLQIFLDGENFGPGKLDGKLGEFTRKALARYGRAHHRELPEPGPALLVALPEVGRVEPFTEYTVTGDDLAEIGTMSEDRVAQGKQKSMPYTSMVELAR